MNTKIIGTGSAVPSCKLDNAELSTFWIPVMSGFGTRTGIRSRHIAQEGQTASAQAQAAKKAIADAGIAAEQIGSHYRYDQTPDYIFPSTATCPTGDWGRARGMF